MPKRKKEKEEEKFDLADILVSWVVATVEYIFELASMILDHIQFSKVIFPYQIWWKLVGHN